MIDKEPPVLGMHSGAATMAPESDGKGERAGFNTMFDESWLKRSMEAYSASTVWFDASLRAQIQKNMANFRSVHPEGSKYHKPSWLRSNLFRPKTRSMIRRTEAASGVAFFATSDLVNVAPFNRRNPVAARNAKMRQKMLQKRLDDAKTLWFQTVIGAVQDAAVQGICIAHVYWSYKRAVRESIAVYETEADADSLIEEKGIETENEGEEVILDDRPAVDLIPIENFRFSPVCDWRDPIGTSPYLIYLIPSTVGEVRRMIAAGEVDADRTLADDNSLWCAISRHDYDSIRVVREGGRVDRYENETAPEHETVWIHRHVHRINGLDWCWDTVGDQILLRVPRDLEDCYPYLQPGRRPYVIGTLLMETHRPVPASPTELVAPMQDEINEQTNLRMDAGKMATFGRWRVRRGAAVDTQTLKAGIPQSIIAMDDLNRDLAELRSQDVPQSAFMEADRLGVEFDDLSGKFSTSSVANNRQLNETVGGMNLLNADASQVTELELRTISKTFVEPVLQHIYDMQSLYEDDAELLEEVGQAFGAGPQEVIEALGAPGTVTVNVGFNATSPERRIQRIAMGFQTIGTIFPQKLQQANQAEFVKEVMGALGFDDGERFFPSEENEDPQVADLKAQVAQLTQMLEGKQMEVQGRIQVAQIQAASQDNRAQLDAQVRWELGKLQAGITAGLNKLEAIDRMLAAEQNDVKRRELNLQREALSHSINESNRNFQLKVRQMDQQAREGGDGKGGKKPKALPAPASDGPKDLPGEDKAGVIARDDYGAIPSEAG
jgi:hypothetical protein